MKHIYILSRFQAKDHYETLLQRLKELSDRLGRDYEIRILNRPEDTVKIREDYRDTEHIITAVGGDGSINHLLNALMGSRNVLSFLPFGTGNDFYRSCMRTLTPGIHDVDVIRINDRYFINSACFGIDADIANDERFIHNRIIPKPLRFHAGVLYHFMTHKKGRHLKIECRGNVLEGEFTTVVVANNQYYGGGYRVSPSSRMDDGRMEVYAVDQLGRPAMAKIILSMKHAGHLTHPALKKMQTDEVTISSPSPFTANIDGEPLYGDRFDLSLIPKGIRLYYDQALTEELRHQALLSHLPLN